jgi:outer membrane protein TolC
MKVFFQTAGFIGALCLGVIAEDKSPAAPQPTATPVEATDKLKETAAVPDAQGYDLERCIQTALDNNYDIQKAKERIRRQRGMVVEVKATKFPQANVTSNIQQVDKGFLETSIPGILSGKQNSWAANLEVSYAIYTGGRNDAQIQRQKALEDAALFELQIVVNNSLLDVRERYFAVLQARSEVVVQEQYIGLLEEELKSERNKYEAGTVSSFNVLRAEVALANGRTPLIRARNNLRIAIEELTRVLGFSSRDPTKAGGLNVVGELLYSPYDVQLANALQVAQESRPEFKRLDKMVQATTHNLRFARTGHEPQISAFAGYGVQDDDYSASLKDEVHGWTVGLRGTWAAFDGLATEGRIKQARSDFMLAMLELEQMRLNVDVEVRRAYSSFVEATELLAASKKVVEQAVESLRLAKARFDVGAATQLDVLDTQVALTRARSNEVLALHDYNVSCARLNKAMGVAEKYKIKTD